MDSRTCPCLRIGCPKPPEIPEPNRTDTTSHVKSSSVIVQHGSQGSSSWVTRRVGTISASVAKKFHSAKDIQVKYKYAHDSCRVLEVQQSLNVPAVQWGREHETASTTRELESAYFMNRSCRRVDL